MEFSVDHIDRDAYPARQQAYNEREVAGIASIAR
jgi:hypothetical protein